MAQTPGRYCYFLLVCALTATLLSNGSTQSSDGSTVCQTDACWSMSSYLHASLNTSANPCVDFEEFLCGGFRASHQFTGESLLSGKAYMDYMQQWGTAYSQRVTEQVATGCWHPDCPHQPKSDKLCAYERVVAEALRDCAALEANGNQTLHDLVRLNLHEVVDEAIDLGVAGLPDTDRELRFESLMPAQSAKSLHSPLTAVANIATVQGRPALVLVATEPFVGLQVLSTVLGHFPMQMSRLFRKLRIRLPRGLFGLIRYAQASIQLWDFSCNRTATHISNATRNQPVQTVADAKRLLRLANLTFDLDEFLRLSAISQQYPAVSDSTDLLLVEPVVFLHTACMLDQCTKRRPDLIKVLVMHQIALLAVSVLKIPDDSKCFDELFGVGGRSGLDSVASEATDAGVFRPLLHARYARNYASPDAEVEARDVFAQLKATYVAAMAAGPWIPSHFKPVLSRRINSVKLRLHKESVSEEKILRHYGVVMDGMSRGCTLAMSPACMLVRIRALQMSIAVRSIHASLDNESPHYDQLEHSVYLTPAFSDPPHYRPAQPLAVRLGLLGFVFAHELTHALLAEVSPADALAKQSGRSVPGDQDDDQLPASWPEGFASEFRARESCLRDRLAAEQALNKTSVVEDVADKIGLSVTRRTLARSGDTVRLPGYMARYSPEQLLYMTSMRTFCSKAVPSFWRRFLAVSAKLSHTPGRMRIKSMLSGDAEHFRRAFGCPAPARAAVVYGDGKCSFW